PARVAQPWPASRRWSRLRDLVSGPGRRFARALMRPARDRSPHESGVAGVPLRWRPGAGATADRLPAPECRVARRAAHAIAGDAAGAHVAPARRRPLRLVARGRQAMTRPVRPRGP